MITVNIHPADDPETSLGVATFDGIPRAGEVIHRRQDVGFKAYFVTCVAYFPSGHVDHFGNPDSTILYVREA